MSAQVVITRKDKRLKWGWHGLAFVLTGGTSTFVTAGKAVTNASYNRRTQRMATQWTEEERAYFAAHVPPQR